MNETVKALKLQQEYCLLGVRRSNRYTTGSHCSIKPQHSPIFQEMVAEFEIKPSSELYGRPTENGHTCERSRISRKTPRFELYATLTQRRSDISGIFSYSVTTEILKYISDVFLRK